MRCGCAAADQVRDSVGKRVGLAGTGTGNDQQWAVATSVRSCPVLHGEPLLRVQRRQEVVNARSCRLAIGPV